MMSAPIRQPASAAAGAGAGSAAAIESLAGEWLGGGSRRLQVPRLEINKGYKRETAATFMARTHQSQPPTIVVLPWPTPQGATDLGKSHKCLFYLRYLVPVIGLEPTTPSLRITGYTLTPRHFPCRFCLPNF